MKNAKSLSRIFKALSNPHRLDLFLRIKKHHQLDMNREKKKTCFLSSICENLSLGAPTISHHLKELVNAGLVEVEKEGKFAVCTLNSGALRDVQEVFKGEL